MKKIIKGERSKFNLAWVFRLFGIVCLWFILWKVDFQQMSAILKKGDYNLVAIAVSLYFLLIGLKTMRWQLLLRGQGSTMMFRTLYVAYMSSLFIGYLTPGRLGEFVKVVYVTQATKLSSGLAFASVLMDRIFDLYALLLVGSFGLIAIGIENINLTIISIIWAILILPFVFFIYEPTFTIIKSFISRLGSKGENFVANDSWLVDVRRGFLKVNRFTLFFSSAITIIAYGVFFSQTYLLAKALGLEINFIDNAYTISISSLITLLPISVSGIGTRDVAIVTFLGAMGIPEELSMSFSLLFFITFYIFGGIFGALFWLIKPVSWSIVKKTEQQVSNVS